MDFDEWYDSSWIGRCDKDEARVIWDTATKVEREECANVVEHEYYKDCKAATAIRARSNA